VARGRSKAGAAGPARGWRDAVERIGPAFERADAALVRALLVEIRRSAPPPLSDPVHGLPVVQALERAERWLSLGYLRLAGAEFRRAVAGVEGAPARG
jgi:hypothetical protein